MYGHPILHNQYMLKVRAPGPFTFISFTAFDECVAASFWNKFPAQSIKYQMIPVKGIKTLRGHLFRCN